MGIHQWASGDTLRFPSLSLRNFPACADGFGRQAQGVPDDPLAESPFRSHTSYN